MKKALLAVLAAALLTPVTADIALAGGDDYLGEISIFAGNFAPRGHAFCEGQVLSIAQYTALFSLLGTRYGGDGRTTFALPDLREAEKSLHGVRYVIALEGLFPPRN